jgi:hypothetical protein
MIWPSNWGDPHNTLGVSPKGYPTIMLFQGNQAFTYYGDRTLESLERFIESPTQPSTVNMILEDY